MSTKLRGQRMCDLPSTTTAPKKPRANEGLRGCSASAAIVLNTCRGMRARTCCASCNAAKLHWLTQILSCHSMSLLSTARIPVVLLITLVIESYVYAHV